MDLEAGRLAPEPCTARPRAWHYLHLFFFRALEIGKRRSLDEDRDAETIIPGNVYEIGHDVIIRNLDSFLSPMRDSSVNRSGIFLTF